MSLTELLAVSTAIAGSLLIAWGNRPTVIAGWLLSLAASVAWGVFAIRVASPSLLVQQLFFGAIGMLALYRLFMHRK